jgi:ATP-binding cassette subfamily C exporter for protease/lipase
MNQIRSTSRSTDKNPLRVAIKSLRTAFLGVGLFSFAINVLMLAGPLFMLQVYDRVLTGRSVPTLVAFFALVVGLYLFLGLFDFVRTRVMSRSGYWLDLQLGGPTFRTFVCQGIAGKADTGRPIQDLGIVRSFLGSSGLMGMFDMPWMPFYLAFVFVMHSYLGLLALGGAVLVTILALANEFVAKPHLGRASVVEAMESRFVEQSHRNAEVIVAMGMLGNIGHRWQNMHGEGAERAQAGGEASEIFAATSKAVRLLLQSAILALGAWLAIRQEISPGMIVAASIIAGRALAPVDQVIGQWSAITRARLAYKRLLGHLDNAEAATLPLQLPEPAGRLQIRGLTKLAPGPHTDTSGGRRVILNQIAFSLEPGDGLGVIGPSASGKSTLARLLVGAWTPDAGTVRLDAASLEHWDNERLGRHIGYLPQAVELIAGTIQQNIARFDPHADDGDIVRAAQIAGVHEMILRLPDGYSTLIGYGTTPLSGGQIQRIGLARALFRMPKLVVLDEPNSNLDADGDAALTAAIEQMRAAGSVVIVMAHRPSAIAAVNKIMMLQNGNAVEFGDKAEVLRKVTRVATA